MKPKVSGGKMIKSLKKVLKNPSSDHFRIG
jgi:hypothetical protein